MADDDPIALLREIARETPTVDDPDEGRYCFYCGEPCKHFGQTHTATCVFVRVRVFLARVSPEAT